MVSSWVESSVGFRDLIGDLHEIAAAAPTEAALVASVAQRLRTGGERRAVIARYRSVPDKNYSQSIIYVDPDRRFSIVALTWAPGALTRIHDHAGWCALTVFEGVEHEQRFDIAADSAGAHLIELDSRLLEPGQSIGMVADGRDIHRVGSSTGEVTLSLHVYGLDIERAGSSIKTCYDALPVRA